MFGLKNFSGSCWVNTCLQSVFRIPDVQRRYSQNNPDPENNIDVCLFNIWITKGEDGLKDLFRAIKTSYMPAGNGIGDAHELLIHLCDKLPSLDKLFRFKIASTIKCIHCNNETVKEDSVIEMSFNEKPDTLINDCILNTTKAQEIPDWECEKCKKKGCTKQVSIGSFPKCMLFYNLGGNINYPGNLIINNRKYILISVASYDAFHWWAYGRNLLSDEPTWYSLNDTRVQDHGPSKFPLSSKMKFLIYYQLEN